MPRNLTPRSLALLHPAMAQGTKLRSLGSKLQPSSRVKVRLPPKVAESFYSSPPWLALIDQIKRERWPILLARYGHYCEDRQCTERHSARTRIVFDHVKERRDHPGLALVKANIMGRCWPSHTRKTAEERRKRQHT